jgi:hypothetical protein
MDRFAELAMTVLNLALPGCSKIESVAIEYERAIPLRPSSPRRRVIAQSETSEKKSRGRGVVDRPVKPDDDSSLSRPPNPLA